MEIDYISAIEGELEAKIESQSIEEQATCVGIFKIKTANQTIKDASKQPQPVSLWKCLWYEGEVCCLFSDSNLGKSVYAVQIAEHIAQTRKVLYFDFELTEKQFQERYTDEYNQTHTFPPDLYRVEINHEEIDPTRYDEALLDGIEQAALNKDVKVLIIDNLTYLCSCSEKGEIAGLFMTKLSSLKHKHGFSILVLAHTPKRFLSNPITQNDLAGSKKLYNFFDSCFALGQSVKGENYRYIIQLKVRYGALTFGKNNVIICTVEKEGDFLHFVERGCSTEREHLRDKFEERKEFARKVKSLAKEGLSERQIASQLKSNKSTVHHALQNNKWSGSNEDATNVNHSEPPRTK